MPDTLTPELSLWLDGSVLWDFPQSRWLSGSCDGARGRFMNTKSHSSTAASATCAKPAGEDPGKQAAMETDSSGLVTRGVGRCLGKYFPHLLKNNFNRVLLVDEDPDVHVSFNQVLTTAGYLVQHAISEIDAIQIIKDDAPDFLLINWKKASPSGLPFYESLRRGFADKYLYIIVMTTEDVVRNKVQMIASGADAFLVKPIPPGELLSLLQAGTRIIEQQLRMKELAMHDPLTGLLNRSTFMEMRDVEWNGAERKDEPISCAAVDIDHFKNINDVYGHIHGDCVLTRIGEIMRRIGRKSDLLCRHGGDKFYILMPNTDLEGALTCGERLRAAVVAEKRFFPEEVSFPTVTVGVATRTGDLADANLLLARADEALSWGKRHDRNLVAAYDASSLSIAVYDGETRALKPTVKA